ncbi:hypothetical protein GCM10020000_18400 [Streptomyces olivoverticillatus]
MVSVLEGVGERGVGGELAVLLHAGDDDGDGHVEHGADGERAEDAAGDVALGGLRVSSAAVATMSKPMKAKKTTAAAEKMPMTPKLEG